MNSKIKRIYAPMTESGFYILFCLQQAQHGYGISQQVRKMTGGELIISAGTMYGTLTELGKEIYSFLIVYCGVKLRKLRDKYNNE